LQEERTSFKARLKDERVNAQNKEKNKEQKDITLIGQVRAVPLPLQLKGKVVQVVWTGVRGKDKKCAYFKEPLISTFKYEKSSLPKGLKLTLQGKKAELDRALKRLEQGVEEEGLAHQ